MRVLYSLFLLMGLTTIGHADISDSGSLNLNGQAIVGGTMTISGNAFSVRGSTVVISNGSIGIGINNPAVTLHVQKNGFVVQFDSGSATGQDIGNITYGVGTSSSFDVYGRAGHSLGLGSNGTNRMLIDTSGNVGIATTGPATRFHVVSSDDEAVRVESAQNTRLNLKSQATGEDMSFQKLNTSGGGMRILSNGGSSELVRFLNSGNVGIGTAEPQEKLEVAGNILSSGTVFGSLTLVGKNSSPHVGGTFNIGTNQDGEAATLFNDATQRIAGYSSVNKYWRFYTNGTERLRIDSTGKVGIGTNGPSYQLELSQDSAAKPTSNTWTVPSDGRLKKDIGSFTDGLNVITQINPVKYKLNGKAGMPRDAEGIGVIAEDIQKILPYTIKPFKRKMDPKSKTEKETELLGFNSGPLTFVLINAIKEQQKQIEGLKSEVKVLQQRLSIRPQ